MLRKAQSLSEIAIMAAVVALITITTVTIYNNQKLELVKKSAVTVTENGSNNGILGDDDLTQLPDTTGRASSPGITGRTGQQYLNSLSNLTGGTLADNVDVVTAANQSGSTISTDESDQDILLSLIKRLDIIAAKDKSTWTAAEKIFVANFTNLLDDADVLATKTPVSHKPKQQVAATTSEDNGESISKTTTGTTTSTATYTVKTTTTATNTCKETGICSSGKELQVQ